MWDNLARSLVVSRGASTLRLTLHLCTSCLSPCADLENGIQIVPSAISPTYTSIGRQTQWVKVEMTPDDRISEAATPYALPLGKSERKSWISGRAELLISL